jgi:predicted TPR repeat methyltransferase
VKIYINKEIQSQLELIAEINNVTTQQLVNNIAQQWLREMESIEEAYNVQEAQSAYEHSLLFA